MTSTSEKTVTPWSPEAEQSVLGAILLDNSSAYRVADVAIAAESFYSQTHRQIWAAAMALIAANKPADVITVHDALADEAQACGGLSYLNDLAQSVPSAANIRRYAEIVVERAQRRELVTVADQVHALAASEGSTAELVDKAQGLVLALKRQDAKREAVKLGESVLSRHTRWEAMGLGEVAPGLLTRLPGLDRCLGGGLQRGRVFTLAARPSIGKTSLAVQMALNVAKGGHKVLILSQEMPQGDLTDRITANLGRIDLGLLMTGIKPDDGETWSRVSEAAEDALRLGVLIDDQPALSLMAIRGKAQIAKARSGLDLLVIDYLQLCSASDRKASRHHQIEEISRGLKTLAKELDCCVLLLSQINRDVTKADREPGLSDLKESGAIEEDADVVMFLNPVRELQGGAQLLAGIIAKNRQGQKGRIALRFEGATQRWGECELDVTPQPAQPARRAVSPL